MKRLTLVIISTILGFLYSQLVLTVYSPGYSFWKEVMDRKKSELLTKRIETKNITIFTGGSSCAFSIDPEVLEEAGIQAYNYGGAVMLGARYILASTFENAQSGDTIVLALETHFLTEEGSTKGETMGLSMANAEGDSEEKQFFETNDTFVNDRLKLRPGSRYLITLYGKKILGHAPYRYNMDDFKMGGRLETNYRDSWVKPRKMIESISLSSEGIELLKKCKKLAEERQIDLYYSLPWSLSDTEFVNVNRSTNKQLLDEIENYIEVLYDPNFGVVAEPNYFSDTIHHLTDIGSKERSKIIARSLKNRQR